VKPSIKRAAATREYLTPEGCWILEVANDADDETASIARARVAPGVATEWHLLDDTAERYLIIQGRGCAEVGDLREDVGPGDVVQIPPGVPQRITNIGDEDLIFYCLCTPRFRPENYQTAT
jgi:mannose-6-phosphate isomerase-like protein (cupin superfamily)